MGSVSCMAKRRQVPNQIEALRRECKMSQRKLAELVGVDAATVSRWERRLAIVHDHRKAQLASILGEAVGRTVTRGQLMGWDEDERAAAPESAVA